MEGNGRGVRGNGINRGSGGYGGIYTVYSSITWAITAPATDPPASVNGESGRTGIFSIGRETTAMNDSSFRGYGDGA